MKQPKCYGFREIKFYKIILPDEFILIQDTNEQKPLFGKLSSGQTRMFNNSMVRNLTVLGQNLKHGDYSVKGFESQIIAERKMPSDFYQYVGKDRDHKSKPKGITTVDKLEYISQATCKMLLVEASFKGLYGFPFTGCSQSSARAFFYSTLIKYGIPKFVTPDRTEMRRLIIEHFYYTYRLLRGER